MERFRDACTSTSSLFKSPVVRQPEGLSGTIQRSSEDSREDLWHVQGVYDRAGGLVTTDTNAMVNERTKPESSFPAYSAVRMKSPATVDISSLTRQIVPLSGFPSFVDLSIALCDPGAAVHVYFLSCQKSCKSPKWKSCGHGGGDLLWVGLRRRTGLY